jgi:HEAT repeat protein
MSGERTTYTDKLIRALEHPEPQTRVRAAWLLGKKREARAVPALMAAIERSTDDPELLAVAAWSLGVIGDAAAIPTLVWLARRSFLKARVAAVDALGRWAGRRDVRELLRSAAASDPNERVRAAATSALAGSARG